MRRYFKTKLWSRDPVSQNDTRVLKVVLFRGFDKHKTAYIKIVQVFHIVNGKNLISC